MRDHTRGELELTQRRFAVSAFAGSALGVCQAVRGFGEATRFEQQHAQLAVITDHLTNPFSRALDFFAKGSHGFR
jgi:hypothetical protein